MTAPIVTTYSRTPLNLSDPNLRPLVDADDPDRLWVVRPAGQLWERLAERAS